MVADSCVEDVSQRTGDTVAVGIAGHTLSAVAVAELVSSEAGETIEV